MTIVPFGRPPNSVKAARSIAGNGQGRQGARLHPPRTGSGGQATPGYLPLKELAAYCGLSVRTLRTYLTRRFDPLPHYKIGGKILVRRTEFDNWMDQFRIIGIESLDDVVEDVLKEFGAA